MIQEASGTHFPAPVKGFSWPRPDGPLAVSALGRFQRGRWQQLQQMCHHCPAQ